jgi:hypothetical protein
MAKQVKPGLTQPKRFMGHRKSADVIRTQPENSIRARGDKPQTEAECMAAIFYLENRNRKKGLGKKGRPCMKRDRDITSKYGGPSDTLPHSAASQHIK